MVRGLLLVLAALPAPALAEGPEPTRTATATLAEAPTRVADDEIMDTMEAE